MILDKSEFEILRLTGLYRHIPHDGFDSCGLPALSRKRDMLSAVGLLSPARSREYFTLSKKGYALLRDHGYPYEAGAKRAYSGSKHLTRRLRTASVMLACLRAGIDVFPDDVYALAGGPAFLPAFMLRGGNGSGMSLMNAASCVGFGRLGDTAYMFQYAGAESKGMYLTNELSHLFSLASVLGPGRTPAAMIFAAKSCAEVYARVQKSIVPENKRSAGFVDFRDAHRNTDVPVHLLPCDETGAKQLAVMARAGYGAKIARAAFGERWNPCDGEIPDADGCVGSIPLIVGVGMDIKRAERVWNAAKRLGRKEVMLAALPKQLSALYVGLLPEGGLVTPLSIGDDLLAAAFGKDFSLCGPEYAPATDAGGGFIHV